SENPDTSKPNEIHQKTGSGKYSGQVLGASTSAENRASSALSNDSRRQGTVNSGNGLSYAINQQGRLSSTGLHDLPEPLQQPHRLVPSQPDVQQCLSVSDDGYSRANRIIASVDPRPDAADRLGRAPDSGAGELQLRRRSALLPECGAGRRDGLHRGRRGRRK